MFTIVKEARKTFPRFRASGLELSVKILPPSDSSSDPASHFKNAFDSILEYCLRSAGPHDKIGLTIRNETNSLDRQIGISFRLLSQINSDVVWSTLEQVVQSNSRFQSTDLLTFTVQIINMPNGNGGGTKSRCRSVSEMTISKKSIVSVKSEKNCLIHAAVISIAKQGNDPYYKSYRDGKKTILPKVDKILREANLNLDNGAGIEELLQLQRYLKEYKIVVYGSLNINDIIFNGHSTSSKRINLLYDAQSRHYSCIINMLGAMATRFICQGCNASCKRGETHHCDLTCSACNSVPPCNVSNERVYCSDCNNGFRGAVCFENHKTLKISGKTVCEKKKRCRICNVIMGNNHECYKSYCSRCHANKELDHMCYMSPLSRNVPSGKKILYVFYDFETTQNTRFSQTAYEHVPNLVAVQQFCSACEDQENFSVPCVVCGVKMISYWDNPVESLIKHVTTYRLGIEKVVAIAHNSRSFDAQFILKYALEHKWKANVVMNGTKIMKLGFEHVTFLDSLNYFGMPLRDLSKAFGLTCEKTWFPHYFNTPENLSYIGPMPDKGQYGYDNMSITERQEFEQWYDAKCSLGQIFDCKSTLEKYCQDDVSVLRSACQTFRKLFLEYNIECFLESATIASCCIKVFRKNFLKPNVIGLIPASGYNSMNRQSKQAIMWMNYIEARDGIKIRHARNGKEFRIGNNPYIWVDGYCAENNTVYEFYGDIYHGCVCLSHRDRALKMSGGKTMAERHEDTLAREEYLKKLGYNVVSIWECQFQDILKQNPHLKEHPTVKIDPINTRDCLYGGRTEALKLYHEIDESRETIQYTDIMSLYPWACKYANFPLGHPIVHVGDACKDIPAMLEKEGIIKCTILPPDTLFHPILPIRCNGRLIFCLCRTCAELENQGTCTHTNEERALRSTWIVNEVRKAVELGYKVLEISDFYEYQVTQYDPETKSGGLFVDYVNTFLKLKAEASGYPDWVQTEDHKDKYISDFYRHEGVRLDKDNIVNNPAKRGLAKLCLNSFWGKLTEAKNRTRTELITEPYELFSFLSTPDVEVTNVLFVEDKVAWVNWRYLEEDKVESLPHTNEVVGAYVTTAARLKLYSYLEKLGTSALYCDTDSVYFLQNRDEPPLVQCGDNLGEMQNELSAGEYIKVFCAAGAKNYCYKSVLPHCSEKCVVKVRGITLNFNTLKVVNFDSIKDQILEGQRNITVHTKNKLKRKRREGIPFVVSEPENKIYRMSFNKRRRLENNDSVPFGYRDPEALRPT